MERTATGFETSVYRKPTFTGQYLCWESFSLTKQKTNLISTLVHRALMICTKSKLNEEIKHIKNILSDNGYPESIIDCNISKKIAHKTPNISHFTFIRTHHTHKQGRGFITCIKNNISFSQLKTPNTSPIELKIIKIHFSISQQLHITNMYILPKLLQTEEDLIISSIWMYYIQQMFKT